MSNTIVKEREKIIRRTRIVNDLGTRFVEVNQGLGFKVVGMEDRDSRKLCINSGSINVHIPRFNFQQIKEDLVVLGEVPGNIVLD